jgi:hypothetical protein
MRWRCISSTIGSDAVVSNGNVLMSNQDEELNRIAAPVGNNYGGPAVWAKDGRYFIGIENWSGWDEGHEISKEFFDAWLKEFAPQ